MFHETFDQRSIAVEIFGDKSCRVGSVLAAFCFRVWFWSWCDPVNRDLLDEGTTVVEDGEAQNGCRYLVMQQNKDKPVAMAERV